MVKINGKQQDCAGRSIASYLKEAGYDATRVAVEVNGEIVPKRSFGETVMKDGDTVEVVGFVGGG